MNINEIFLFENLPYIFGEKQDKLLKILHEYCS